MLQPVRGTHDLLPDQMAHFQEVLNKARFALERYGFREMATPMFEFTNVFFHVGETSDIVTKEAYTFQDRGGDSLTLRPEGTAAVVRSVISNGLTQSLPLKYMYAGPMFRYDRPQKGRYRQFHQLGVELIGQEGSLPDAEAIISAFDVLRVLELHTRCQLQINTLGDIPSRLDHREKLVSYFSKVKDQLSPESLIRLEKNPLRILDSKDPRDQKFFPEAPKLQECLSDGARKHFDEVCELLSLANVPFIVNPLIVRGLDYYVHTTFEFIMDEASSQGTVLGGGRYDGLFKAMGGPEISAVGWAAGIERLMMLHEFQPVVPQPIALVGLGDEVRDTVFRIACQLRSQNHYVEILLGHNPGKLFKKADKMRAKAAITVGSEELKEKSASIKCLQTGIQKKVALDALAEILQSESFK